MLPEKTTLIEKLLNNSESTTDLLQQLTKHALSCSLEFQKKYKDDDSDNEFLLRSTKLYFKNKEFPVIYSISSIDLSNLTQEEILRLKDGNTPIGAIFNFTLTKTDICVREHFDQRLQKILKTSTDSFFQKSYKLWSKSRYIGIVKEIFNTETLERF